MLKSAHSIDQGAAMDRSLHERDLLRLFFDSPFVGMAITSPRTRRWVTFNDELCRILGYPREQLELLTWTEITHPDDLAADLGEFQRVMAGDSEGYRIQKRFIRPDGRVVHAAIDVRCVRRADGSVDFFLATVRDATAEVQGEAALARSRDLYAMLSGANAAVARATDERMLLEEICRLAVDTGGFRYAFAFVGNSAGEMHELAWRAAPAAPPLGPASRPVADALLQAWSLIARQPVVTRVDLAGTELAATLAQQASTGNDPELIALPILRNGTLAGAVALVATSPQADLKDTHPTLEQVSKALSYAFDSIEARRARERATSLLEDTRGQLQAIIDASTSAIWLADREGRFQLVNQALATIFDRKPPELLGRSRDELMDAVSAAEHRSADQQVFDSGQALTTEELLRGGEVDRAFLSVKFPLLDRRGEVYVVGGIATDITEQRRSREALRMANQRWESLVNASPAAIFDMNLEGQVLSVWNPAAERLFGERAADVLGHPLPIHDPTLAHAAAAIHAEVAAGQVVTGREIRLIRQDGAEVGFEVSAAPIRDDVGAIRSLLCVAVDVTDRLVAQCALAESESSYRLLFENHPTPMCIYDLSSRRILAGNAAALESYRYTRDEFVRRQIEDLTDASERMRAIATVSTVGTGPRATGIWKHQRSDGTHFDAEVHSHALKFKGQDARLVMATDVSEMVRAQHELQLSDRRLRSLNLELEDRIRDRTEQLVAARDRAENADRVKSMFLATVSHELRTPLNSIIGFSDALLRELAGPLTAEQAKQLRIVGEAGQHLLALIGDFLDISKIEAGVISYDNRDVDLCELLRSMAADFAEQCAKTGLAFELQDAADGCLVTADARRVRQVVSNFFSNALKFTDAGGISLGLERRPNSARIWIQDTGIGIAASDAGQLFQPFARLSPQGHRAREGTGLGLAIASRLAEGMGGQVGFDSEPGRGSRFWIDLPHNARQEHPCAS